MARKGENIYRRKDGRWEGRYIADRTMDGKAVYRSVYAKTYTQAKQKLQEAKETSQQTIEKRHLPDTEKGADIFLSAPLLKSYVMQFYIKFHFFQPSAGK